MHTPHEYYIIGSGLAAILMASELIERGVSPAEIVLCAPHSSAPKASDVPGALMHPLPGTTLAPKQDTMLAYDHAARCIKTWQQRYPQHVLAASMMRPDRGGRKGKRFIKTYTRAHAEYHEAMTHELIERDTINARSPGMHHDAQRAVLYGPTYCVALGALLPSLRQDLISLGVQHHALQVDSIRQNEQTHWDVYTHDSDEPMACARRVVLAMGAGLATWFPDLEVHVNGGELAVVDADPELALDVMISGGGHISPMPGCAPNAWVMGSTYLRPDESHSELDEGAFVRDDEDAITQLREMVGTFYPPVHKAPVRQLWRGRRAVYTPDKHPLVGELQGSSGVYVLGALGSKGLLWGPLAAHQLGQLLTDQGVPTFSEPCDGRRASRKAWLSPRITPLSSRETNP